MAWFVNDLRQDGIMHGVNSSTKYEKPKFDRGKSFSHWKSIMWSSLLLQGLWKAVEFSWVSEESKDKLKDKVIKLFL